MLGVESTSEWSLLKNLSLSTPIPLPKEWEGLGQRNELWSGGPKLLGQAKMACLTSNCCVVNRMRES